MHVGRDGLWATIVDLNASHVIMYDAVYKSIGSVIEWELGRVGGCDMQ